MKILPEELPVFTRYVQSICGVNLDDSKAYLLESRLSSLAEEIGCGSFSELYYKARSDLSKTLPRRIIDAITTSETLFFRDTAPFDLLRHKILPDFIDQKTKLSSPNTQIPIRIWSAACSTGQEVYSIAIILKELIGGNSRFNIKLLGTDISNRVIAQASRGIYNHIEIERGLSQDKVGKYFTCQNDVWKIRDEIRSMATFRTANLLEDLSSLGRFDIIFCRNVAIYFNEQDKISLFNRIAKVIDPQGYLIIGSTESITGISPSFEPHRHLRSVYYQLKMPEPAKR
jgi:chemotaxis protein methyltransferase CheR